MYIFYILFFKLYFLFPHSSTALQHEYSLMASGPQRTMYVTIPHTGPRYGYHTRPFHQVAWCGSHKETIAPCRWRLPLGISSSIAFSEHVFRHIIYYIYLQSYITLLLFLYNFILLYINLYLVYYFQIIIAVSPFFDCTTARVFTPESRPLPQARNRFFRPIIIYIITVLCL